MLGTACPSRALRGKSGFIRWVWLFGSFTQQEQGSVDDPSGSSLDVWLARRSAMNSPPAPVQRQSTPPRRTRILAN
jgi:hypothetical protein